MKIIIFGAQGAGKGTQAENIAQYFKIPHLSTGDIFRENIKKGTDLGKLAASLINDGKLVPDDITNNLVKQTISQSQYSNGFILDGYPRNLSQAEFLDNITDIDFVIDLEVEKKELIRRISSRRVCEKCGTNYNLIYVKPKNENFCDLCNGKLMQRDDDKEEAVNKRLDIYYSQTKPLEKFYEKKGILFRINGAPAIEEVFKEIKKVLE
jgi:adenylate kinase